MSKHSTVEKIKVAVTAAVLTLAILPLPLPAASNSYVQSLINKVTAAQKKAPVVKSASKKAVIASPKKATAPKTSAQTAQAPAQSTVVSPATFPSITSAAAAAGPTPINPSELNAKTRAALVNILCTTKSGGSFRPISGSGVIIDPRGIILTNAHVAQYLLLKDYFVPDFVSCVIRMGSPAQPLYKAEIMHLPSKWIEGNASEIGKRVATGTGQHDYALLAITSPITPDQTLPSQFPFIAPDTEYADLEQNAPVLVAGYPAELAGAITTQRDLHSASTYTQIDRAYYFNDSDAGKIDLFSVGSTILAQGGSSGGAVVDGVTGKLIGIIVTTTSGTTTESKKLQAVSIPHINRSLIEHTNTSLSSFLLGDKTSRVREFLAGSFENQKQALIAAIEHK